MSILKRFRRASTKKRDDGDAISDNNAESTAPPSPSKESSRVSTNTPPVKSPLRSSLRGELLLSDLTLPAIPRQTVGRSPASPPSEKASESDRGPRGNGTIEKMSDNQAVSNQIEAPRKDGRPAGGSRKTVAQPSTPTLTMPVKQTLRLNETDRQKIYDSIGNLVNGQSENGQSEEHEPADNGRKASPENRARPIDSTWVDERPADASRTLVSSTLVYEPPVNHPSKARHRPVPALARASEPEPFGESNGISSASETTVAATRATSSTRPTGSWAS